jgi:hypothetical protein
MELFDSDSLRVGVGEAEAARLDLEGRHAKKLGGMTTRTRRRWRGPARYDVVAIQAHTDSPQSPARAVLFGAWLFKLLHKRSLLVDLDSVARAVICTCCFATFLRARSMKAITSQTVPCRDSE